ncbi:MAG TPA: glycosyltransferase family 87 protein [Bradyrhizobium sp.]|nr:glycosyltransferase family 87 protein [Bradyrhizobium sp.]
MFSPLTAFSSAVAIAAALICFLVLKRWWRLPGRPLGEEGDLLEHCWRILLCCIFAGLGLELTAMLIAGDVRDTTLVYAKQLLFDLKGDDSWYPMLKASAQLRDHPAVPIYQTIFFDHKIKFQYPLSALLLIDVPRRIFDLDDSGVLLMARLVSRATVPFFIVTFVLLLVGAVRAEFGRRRHLELPLVTWIVLGLAGFFGILFFYPLTRSEHLGQIQTLMSFDAAVALYAWQRRKTGLAGSLIGFCCIIKPQWCILFIWGLVRRQWRFVLWGAATAAVFLVWAAAVYGVSNTIDYVKVVTYLGKHGESFFANQSVNGLLNRMLFNGNNQQWLANGFPPFNPIVYGATLISSVAFIGTALLWNRKNEPQSLDFALIMLAATIASPIAWEHHYGIVFPIFALLLPACVRARPWGAWTIPLFGIGYILVSQDFSNVTSRLADSRFNVLQSSLLFGAFIIFALLCSCLRAAAVCAVPKPSAEDPLVASEAVTERA